MPSWVPGLNETLLAQGAEEPSGFVPSIFAALSDYKPEARLATLTSNLDEVQIFFYGLMEGVFPPDQATALDWYLSMAGMTAATASLPNYRFYIDAGTFHTFIGDDQRVYEEGANGTTVAEWLTEMIKPGDRSWDTLDAGAPF